MELVRGCIECGRLSESYETETLNWFRLEGQLRVAEYARDQNAIRKISGDLEATIGKRTELRAAIEQHEAAFHKGGTQAGPMTMGA